MATVDCHQSNPLLSFEHRVEDHSQWGDGRRQSPPPEQEIPLGLSDPLQRQVPVAAIGPRWGLSDPAHFSRLFLSHVGSGRRSIAGLQGLRRVL